MDNQSPTICVCGAGTMGSGIAQACAQHGLQVILFDQDDSTVARAKNTIEHALGKLIEKNRLRPEDRIAEKITYTSLIGDCVAGVIIEAVVEDLEVKVKLFNSLALINGPSTIFATNTSSLAITQIAERISRPQQLAGMHFFNPATVMKLVEVVQTTYSSAETISRITMLATSIGKTPVLCLDAPGFIVNHVARPYYLEALYLLERYDAGAEMIDELMEASGFRMGPFRLMDLIGNDINYSVSCIVYEALNRPERLRPSSIQQEKVNSGQLGRKTGSGYYAYRQ